jgi:hypothetical protein
MEMSVSLHSPLPLGAGPGERPILSVRPRFSALALVLGNEISIAKDILTPGLRNRLLRLADFQNPGFYKAQAMHLPTCDKPRGCSPRNPMPAAAKGLVHRDNVVLSVIP